MDYLITHLNLLAVIKMASIEEHFKVMTPEKQGT